MVGSDYLKLQNQGNIISNIRLLYEMDLAKDYADSQGYYTKKNVAEIGVNSLIITSGSKVGDEAHTIINASGDESRNSPLQNAKARMQILRVLGLVAVDYGSEIYAITRLGKLMIAQVLCNNPNYGLLRELFLTITTASENYEHNCPIDFNCFLGYGICYALANLDYRLSSEEMPLLTTYDIRDIEQFISDAKEKRQRNAKFDSNHPHFPKTQQGKPLKQVSNLTRSINQILRVCGIIKPKQEKIGKFNYYVCTDEGKRFVDAVKLRFLPSRFLPAYRFRKINNIAEQKEICIKTLNALMQRSGIDDNGEVCDDIFSPYQMLPETSVEWFLGNAIRKHPDLENERINVLNSQVTARDLRLSAIYTEAVGCITTESPEVSMLRNRMNSAKQDGKEIEQIAEMLCEEYKLSEKNSFYPFVHSLLNIIGLTCNGEVARYDAFCKYDGHIIPVEIKSYTETPTYNAKGIRQAIENKITAYDCNINDDISYASLVIGYAHPTNDAEIRTLIDQAYCRYRIKIIACDLRTLVIIACNVVLKNKVVDLDDILLKYGLLIN